MDVDPRLLRHVEQSSGLSPAQARRLIEDVLAFQDEKVEDWVRRRHLELKNKGLRNAEIYPRIRAELRDLVVAAPDLTERQVRRIVYG